MAVRTWTLKIEGDERDAIRAADKVEKKYRKFGDDVDRHFGKTLGSVSSRWSAFGGKMAVTGRTMARGIGLGVVAGVVALGAGIKVAFDEAAEAVKVGRQTANVIKTMGASGWTSSKQIERLSTRLSNVSGIDDEIIQSGANLLLTFGKIRNEAGKGNDVFDRTVAVANDMSVALGQDMKSSSIQLGKALNDPIKGVTALQRVGVSFTASQKDQIKTLVDSGNTLGAQKLILKEVEKQFGGTAAAVATPWDKLKVTLLNAAETLGLKLLPWVNTAADWLAKRLPGAVDVVIGAIDTLSGYISMGFHAFAAAFSGEGITSTGWVGAIEQIGVVARDWLPRVQGWLQGVKDKIGELVPVVSDFLRQWGPAILTFAGVALTLIKVRDGVSKVQGAMKALDLLGALGPWGLLILAIAALAAGFVIAYQRSEAFRGVVQGVIGWVTGVAVPAVLNFWNTLWQGAQTAWAFVQPIVAAISAFLSTEINKWVVWFHDNWAAIQEATGHVWAAISAYINLALTLIRGYITGWIAVVSFLWNTFGSTIITFVMNAFNAIRNIISGVLQFIRGFITLILALINGDWGKAWEAIKMMFDGIWRAMLGIVQLFLAQIKFVIFAAWNAINFVTMAIWNAIWSFLSGLLNRIIGFFTDHWRLVLGIFTLGLSTLILFIVDHWNTIKSTVGDAIGWVRDRISNVINSISSTWSTIWGGIKDTFNNIWHRIKVIARDAVNFVIGIINGIGNAIQSIAGHIGIHITIRDIPLLSGGGVSDGGISSGSSRATNLPQFHAAGTADMRRTGPFITNGPRAIVGEGNPNHAEFVIPTDPQFRGRALKLYDMLGGELMASGGTLPRGPGISGLYDPLARVVSRIIDRAAGAVSVISGWRSGQRQAQLFAAYQAGHGNLAAPPGRSQHERGAAVDFGGNRPLYTSLARSYGLVAPVRGEPWHWEYPGQGRAGGGGGGGSGGMSVGRAISWIRNAAHALGEVGHKVYDIPRKFGGWIRDKAIHWAEDKVTSFLNVLGLAGGGGPGGRELAAGSEGNRQAAKTLADSRGWTGRQWDALNRLVMSESGWDNTAQNPHSTAYGIFQFLDSTWRSTGYRKTSDPRVQILAGFKYIADRYGDPIHAWAYHQAHNSYKAGGILSFAKGGVLPEDVFGFGPSGQRYEMHKGENVGSGMTYAPNVSVSVTAPLAPDPDLLAKAVRAEVKEEMDEHDRDLRRYVRSGPRSN